MKANPKSAVPPSDPPDLQALIDSEQSLRLVIDTMPGLVWSSRPDGYIDYLNQRWLDYSGYTLEQASGWGWQNAIHPQDAAGLLEYWNSILGSGIVGEYEARLRRHDGAFRWFLFRGMPLRDQSGAVVKWYGTNTDIEDRKLRRNCASVRKIWRKDSG
jgi:PAS domain S-box-containing protein